MVDNIIDAAIKDFFLCDDSGDLKSILQHVRCKYMNNHQQQLSSQEFCQDTSPQDFCQDTKPSFFSTNTSI